MANSLLSQQTRFPFNLFNIGCQNTEPRWVREFEVRRPVGSPLPAPRALCSRQLRARVTGDVRGFVRSLGPWSFLGQGHLVYFMQHKLFQVHHLSLLDKDGNGTISCTY